jgi:hypothetical protein
LAVVDEQRSVIVTHVMLTWLRGNDEKESMMEERLAAEGARSNVDVVVRPRIRLERVAPSRKPRRELNLTRLRVNVRRSPIWRM